MHEAAADAYVEDALLSIVVALLFDARRLPLDVNGPKVTYGHFRVCWTALEATNLALVSVVVVVLVVGDNVPKLHLKEHKHLFWSFY